MKPVTHDEPNPSKAPNSRRSFLTAIAAVTGGIVLAPVVAACTGPSQGSKTVTPATASAGSKATGGKAAPPTQADGLGYRGPVHTAVPVPSAKPDTWDPIAFNKKRGNAGAIPKSYLASINGPAGKKKHLGKHLPYVPTLDAALIPEGHIAIMWGDHSKGYAQHPSAKKDPAKHYVGHWYNWVRVRKAIEGEAVEGDAKAPLELQSSYADWPGSDEEAKKFVAFGGGDITANGGRSTIYLVALPKDVKKGDTVRIWGHCLTHGEFVDFITI